MQQGHIEDQKRHAQDCIAGMHRVESAWPCMMFSKVLHSTRYCDCPCAAAFFAQARARARCCAC